MATAFKRVTPQEYLVRERQASFKSEFYQGQIFAMGGGSANHSLIAANFLRESGNALKGKPCSVFSSDLRVQVRSTGLYTYPDATIVCGELEFEDDQRDTIINPTVIVEVPSDSTEKYDRGRKSSHYRQIASLKELILISQDHPNVELLTRQPNGDWLFHEETDLSADVDLRSLGITVALSELYRNVRFQPNEDNANAES